MSRLLARTAALVVALTLLAAGPAAGLQRTTDFGAQTLGRGYWHMFIAYAIAWVLVFGWAVSIGRRLSSLERRLDR